MAFHTVRQVVSRRPEIEVLHDKWTWSADGTSNLVYENKNIIDYCLSVSFSKSVSAIEQGGSISMKAHLNVQNIEVMDAIKIKIFGSTRFIGYVNRVSFTGMIGNGGKPGRTISISLMGMGSLLQNSSLHWNLALLNTSGLGVFDSIVKGLKTLGEDFTAKGVVNVLVDEYFNFFKNATLSVEDNLKFPSGAGRVDYVRKYLDFDSEYVSRSLILRYHTSFSALYGIEGEVNLWQLLKDFSLPPFNELYFEYEDSKAYLHFRNTPFNGTIGASTNEWGSLESKVISRQYLNKVSLSKSASNIYTCYVVNLAEWGLSEGSLIASGKVEYDSRYFGKYLYKPLKLNLPFPATSNEDSRKLDDVKISVKNYGLTLKNWYKRNDEYLSGSIGVMASIKNIEIGSRIGIENLDWEFYVDAVSVSWSYQSSVNENLQVSRGYRYNGATGKEVGGINLSDLFFNKVLHII